MGINESAGRISVSDPVSTDEVFTEVCEGSSGNVQIAKLGKEPQLRMAHRLGMFKVLTLSR